LISCNPNDDFESDREASSRVWTEVLQNDNMRLRTEVEYWKDKADEYRGWAYHYRDQYNRLLKETSKEEDDAD